MFSSSCVPAAGEPNYDSTIGELRRLFREHERGGTVTLEYDIEVYYGRLPGAKMRGPALSSRGLIARKRYTPLRTEG